MAITVTAGSTGKTTGTSRTGSEAVATPALSAGDIGMLAITVHATTPTLAADPTGYTLLDSVSHNATANAVTYLYYQVASGTVAAGTATATLSGGIAAGSISLVSFKLSGVNTTTPFPSHTPTSSLTASSQTPGQTGDLLLCVYGNREPNATPTTGFTWGTAPSGMTSRGTVSTDVVTATQITQCGTAVYTQAPGSTSATGTKTAATNNTGQVGSISVIASVAGAAVPDAPVITVTSGNTTNTIDWTPPNSSGSSISGYTLQRRTYTGGTPGSYSTIGGGTITSSSITYSDTGLTNGTQYGYHLLATNGTGSSAYSTEVLGTPTSSSGAGTGFIGYLQTIGGLTHHWPLDSTYTTQDVIGGKNFTSHGTPTFSSTGCTFSGISDGDYLEVADDPSFSIAGQVSQGFTVIAAITVTDWTEGSRDPNSTDYCHILGKAGTYSTQEWLFRHYFAPTDPSGQSRQYRMSAYAMNPTDEFSNNHKGAGSYNQTQSAASPTTERMIAATFNTTTTTLPDGTANSTYPGASHLNYNGGAATDTDGFWGGPDSVDPTKPAYGIHPQRTSAPVRVGTTHDGSFFIGKIRRLMMFNRQLTDNEINGIYAQMGLSEGTVGGGAQDTSPGAPDNLVAQRSTSDFSIIDVSWDAPTDDGGDTVTAYKLSYTQNGVTTTPADITGATTYQITGASNVSTTVTVQAKNGVGYGTAATVTVPIGTQLPLIGAVIDNFNGATDPRRVFSTGVVQQNGDLEWTTIDTVRRGTYIRGSFVDQSASFKMTPSTTATHITTFFVRSTADLSRQIRVSYQNGALMVNFNDPGTDASASTKAYNSSSDRYWRIRNTGGLIIVETSPDSAVWTALARSGFTQPTWLADVRVGIEVYTGTFA